MTILCLWSKIKSEFIYITVSDNPQNRRVERFIRKLVFNSVMFRFFATFTFAEHTYGYYPIKDRQLEKNLRKWTGNSHRYKYTGKDTLDYVIYQKRKILRKDKKTGEIRTYYQTGLTLYMYKFLERLKKRLKRAGLTLSYAWKLELGSETSRPHFHMLYSIKLNSEHFITRVDKSHWQFIENLWNSGYVDIVKLDDPRKAINYLHKYLSKIQKKHEIYINPNNRQWSTSSDIKKIPKSENYRFVGLFDDILDAMEFTSDKSYDDFHGTIDQA